MSVEELARKVLHLLERQKVYFKTRSNLKECLALEAEVRRLCAGVLEPPGLFAGLPREES